MNASFLSLLAVNDDWTLPAGIAAIIGLLALALWRAVEDERREKRALLEDQEQWLDWSGGDLNIDPNAVAARTRGVARRKWSRIDHGRERIDEAKVRVAASDYLRNIEEYHSVDEGA